MSAAAYNPFPEGILVGGGQTKPSQHGALFLIANGSEALVAALKNGCSAEVAEFNTRLSRELRHFRGKGLDFKGGGLDLAVSMAQTGIYNLVHFIENDWKNLP